MIEAKSLTLENTVIVGIINSRQDALQSKEYLDELAFLAHTAGGAVIKRFFQNRMKMAIFTLLVVLVKCLKTNQNFLQYCMGKSYLKKNLSNLKEFKTL